MGSGLDGNSEIIRFTHLVLPHLDAGFNLARWLLRGDEADAQDVTQEAVLRAYKSFGNWRGDNARAWLLTIVRNCCYTLRQADQRHDAAIPLDESIHDRAGGASSDDPATLLVTKLDRERLSAAIERLPIEFREALVLREFEGLSYKEIAAVTGVPIGTVMSRLGRARARLAELMLGEDREEA